MNNINSYKMGKAHTEKHHDRDLPLNFKTGWQSISTTEVKKPVMFTDRRLFVASVK